MGPSRPQRPVPEPGPRTLRLLWGEPCAPTSMWYSPNPTEMVLGVGEEWGGGCEYRAVDGGLAPSEKGKGPAGMGEEGVCGPHLCVLNLPGPPPEMVSVGLRGTKKLLHTGGGHGWIPGLACAGLQARSPVRVVQEAGRL